MSGAMATLTGHRRGWSIKLTEDSPPLGDGVWFFPCRGMALQFAERRGITIEGSTE